MRYDESSRRTSTDHSALSHALRTRARRATSAAPSSTCSRPPPGLSMPATAIYCASKAQPDGRSPTARQEMDSPTHPGGSGWYVGYMDTDMTAGITAPKSDPVAVAHQTLDGLVAPRSTCRRSPTTSAATSAAHPPVTSAASTHNSPVDRNLTIRAAGLHRLMWLPPPPAFELESGGAPVERRSGRPTLRHSARAPVGRLRRSTRSRDALPPPGVATSVRKMAVCPNEMVPLQIDLAIGERRYPQAPTVNLSTGILAVPARRAR